MRSVPRSLLAGLAGALVAFGCADHTTSPGPIHPLAQTRDISDGGHNAGNPHFFFLSPMVSHPTYSGASDGSQTPVVRVCDWLTTANGAACGQVVANFTTGGGTDGQAVSYDGTSQYGVNWHTNVCVTGPCTLDPAKIYRVRVLVGSQELGHADVQVVSNGSELKNVQTGDYIGLVDGRTLPVKFRIEQGAIIVVKAGVPAPITPAGGTVGSADGQTSVMIPAGALPTTAPIAISGAPAAPAGGGAWTAPVDLEPTGTTFATPAALTLSFDPTQLPAGVPPSAMGIFTVDANGSWAAVPNSSVNLVDNTVTAPISHFSYYTIGINANVAHATSSDVYIGINQQFTFISWSYYYQTSTGQTCYWSYNPFGTYVCYNNPTWQYPVVNQTVQWQSNSNAATFRSQYSATDANGYATSPIMDTHFYADVVVTATLVGEAGPQGGPVSATSSVHIEPHLQWKAESIKLSPWQKVSDALSIDFNIGLAYTVSLTYLNPGVVFGPDAVSIPVAGFSTPNPPFFSPGVASGAATVRASIPGYLTDDLTVNVGGLGNLLVSGPTNLAVGGATGVVSLQTLSPDNATRAAPLSDEVFALSGNNVAFSDGVNPIASIKVPGGSVSPVNFVVTGTGVGPATISLTNSHYNTATINLTVTGNGSWAAISPDMPTPRIGMSAATVNGVIYTIGGLTGSDVSQQASSVVEAWDPVGGWREMRQLPIANYHMNTVAYNGLIYSFGGWNCYTCVYVYDPSIDMWTRKNDAITAMAEGSALVYNGLIYVFTANANVFVVYNPANDTWQQLPSSPNTHYFPAGSAVIGSKLYLAGGEMPVHYLDVFDLVTQTWSTPTTLPAPRQHGVGAAFNGKLYLFAGTDQGVSATPQDVLVYDPATNSWSTATGIPTPRNIPAGAVLNGSMYVIGGGLYISNLPGTATGKIERFIP